MGQNVYAQELSYDEVVFQNTPALFTSLRVKAASVPKELHRYEIRGEDGQPCQLARGIMADHCGTLLTSDPIQLPVDGYLSFAPPLKNLEVMDAFCSHYAQAAIPGEECTYGFRIETNQYRYMLRCIPVKGTYNAYLYCYGKGVLG